MTKRIRAAYHADPAIVAEAQLEALAKELQRTHPGAAASLREGLAETLTVLRLGVSPTLARTLRSTNSIESMISIARTTIPVGERNCQSDRRSYMKRVLSALILATVTTSCGASATVGPTAESPSTSVDAEAICRLALPDAHVIAWARATVGRLRAYQYGGPVAHRPLAAAFPHAAAAAAAAWCFTVPTSRTVAMWAALPGAAPLRAIQVSGPIDRQPAGLQPGPLQVP